MNNSILWQPQADQFKNLNIAKYIQSIKNEVDIKNFNYEELYQWSIQNIEKFWSSIWDFTNVIGTKGKSILDRNETFQKSRWFSDSTLNYAENLLKNSELLSQEDAIIFWGEKGIRKKLNYKELNQQVKNLAQQLRKMGLKKGDRVAGYLPNIPEAIVAMLATTSVGAIWSSASPDFGVQGVIDRFGQIEPKLFFMVNGYYYNDKVINCSEKNHEILKRLPSVIKAIQIQFVSEIQNLKSDLILDFENLIKVESNHFLFEQVEFNHPLFIMFSSGTTGVPKCIVHGHGGTLLQHLKEHQLHCDLKPKDKIFYFTTLGWMMWNWLASGLASGATLMLYDGSPFYQGGQILFDFIESQKITHFGTSAKFIDAAIKANLNPAKTNKFESLRMVLSTGSPLAHEGFDFVYEKIKKNVHLASISGGTDIISCFVLGNPLSAVYRGEIQCRGLGMAVEVFNEQEKAVKEEKGELICKEPFPSMPVGFWQDLSGEKYHSAYFAKYKNIWCHGDYVELTKNNGMIIYGRSDAVLNPGGVRIGTSEIYRQVEKLSEVQESIVVGQDYEGDVRVILFVKLKENLVLTNELILLIKKTIKENTTPRHVPSIILQVNDIPRTKSGKIVELAVRNIIHGLPVKNIEALANPEALEYFKNRVELQS